MQQISSVLHISTSEETEPIPVVTDNPSAISGIYLVIDTNRHSRLTKLLRVTAYGLHFINNTKMPSQKTSGPLTATELHNTQRPWIKAAQQEVFTKEFDDLKSTTNSQLPLIHQLRLFLNNDSLICCGGRIQFQFQQSFCIYSHVRTYLLN